MFVALSIKLYYFIYPPNIQISSGHWGLHYISDTLINFLGNSPRLYVVLGMINILIQSLIINRIAIAYKLFPSEGFIPAVLFIILTSFLPEWNTLSLPMISLWFILIPLNALLRLPITSMPKKLLFNAGISVSIASLIYFPAVLNVFFIWWAMAIIHPFHWKNVVIVLLGLLAPIYVTASVYFILGLPYNQFLIPAFEWNIPSLPLSISTIVTLSIFILTSIFGIYSLNAYIEKINEPSKKIWWVVIALLVTSSLLVLYKMPNQSAGAYFCLAPLALLASNVWMNDKGKWIKISLFWILVLGALCVQWYL